MHKPASTRGMSSLRIALLTVLALFVVYGSVVVGELVGASALASYLLGEVRLPATMVRIIILSVTALPAAYLTGFGLVRWAPVFGVRAVPVVLCCYILIIVVLQLSVYDANVAVASLLKVLFVALPLLLGSAVANRERLGSVA